MRFPRRIFDQWFGFSQFMVDRSLTRIDRAAEEVSRREYDTGKIICDVMEMWQDSVIGGMAAATGLGDQLPTAFIYLERSSECGEDEVIIFSPRVPHGVAELAFLDMILESSTDGIKISREKCVLSFDRDRHILSISLRDLRPKPKDEEKPLLQSGTYHGLIHIGDAAVANLYIRVSSQPETSIRDRVDKIKEGEKPAKSTAKGSKKKTPTTGGATRGRATRRGA